MAEFPDLIFEFTQFCSQINGLVNMDESSAIEIDESLQGCSKSLALLSEQLELITCQLEQRDKEICLLKCQLQETTAARDSLANLMEIEAELNRNQQNELENIAEISSELETENRNLVSKINEKQSLLKQLQNCEIDIDKQLRMKEELMDFDQKRNAFLDLSEKYNKLQDGCQLHLKIIDDLKSNVSSLEGLSEIVKNLENKNNSLFLECEKKGLLNNELKSQVEEKTKLIVKLTQKLDRSTERCRQLEDELNNILNDNKSLRNDNSSLVQQMGDYNRDLERPKMIITNNFQSSETCQTNETDNEKGDIIVNEKNCLVAQVQESDKSLRKYQHELDISKDQIRKLASLLSENKRHYKCELSKLSENCEKLAFDNLNKDIEIECLKSSISNQIPKSRGKQNAEDQAKVSVQYPKQKVQSRDGSTKSIDSDLSERNGYDCIKEEPKGTNRDKQDMNKEEPKGMNKDKQEMNKVGINKEKQGMNNEEPKGMNMDKQGINKEGINKDKKGMNKEDLNGINKDKQGVNKDKQGINKDKQGINKEETNEMNKDKEEMNKNELINKESREKVIITKSVGVMTDCDEKVGKTTGAEELLRGLISRLPLTKENSRFNNLGKRFKSIDDLRRLQGKAGQMTEHNVRDILIEVKKFYAITMADMQKSFKAEFDKLTVTHEVALSKVKMQQQEKIAQLKREHKDRVDKILTAHEEEIKKISTQQQLIQNVNRPIKLLRKK